MGINKKISRKKILLVIFAVSISAVFIYSRILQSHADESGMIFDDRCNNVNPTLISYKNSFLQMWQTINDNGSSEKVNSEMDNYNKGIAKYLPLESEWLKKQSAFITRWDFQFFEPDYVKDLAKLQLEMYQAQRDNAAYTLNLFENPKEPENFNVSAAKKYIDASNAYFEAYEIANKKDDWRKLLWKAPPINCDPKNLVIPDTSLDKIFPNPVPTTSIDPSRSG